MSQKLHIIMPVKDSIATAEKAIRALVQSGHSLRVYNDNSTDENTHLLHSLTAELGFEVVDIARLTDHPSPNYRYVLIDARRQALADKAGLVIVESDVVVKNDTILKMSNCLGEPGIGLVAAVTHNAAGEVNFPYEYAKRWSVKGSVETKKRLSFCCTLLSYELLEKMDFETELQEDKNWFDVTISHRSVELGFRNILMMDNAVLHTPHSSRPWKMLKYQNPLLYYWRKLTQHKDKI